MAAENQQKHLEFTFCIKAPSFHLRNSIRLLILGMVIPLKIKRRYFFQRDNIPILVSGTRKTRKFKLLYFRNKTCYENENLCKDLLFVYLQPSVNKNS